MAVVRFELPVARFPACETAGFVVERADPVQSASDLVAVVAAGDAQKAEAEMRLRPGGLAAELTSRAGREVWAWIARERAAESRPVGFVALVRVGGENEPRWSIGWLVVDSASRRRGIGTALVATAVRFAAAGGASIVHVETLDRWTAAVAFWGAEKGS